MHHLENHSKATNSLTVLIDIPIAVVLMFQLYRESIEDIFKLVISTLLLKPSQRAKELESFNKDLFITLIGVQGMFSTRLDLEILDSEVFNSLLKS